MDEFHVFHETAWGAEQYFSFQYYYGCFPGSFSYNVLCLWYHVCLVAPLSLTFSIPYVVFYMEIREYSNFWSFIFESERCCDLQHRISLLTWTNDKYKNIKKRCNEISYEKLTSR